MRTHKIGYAAGTITPSGEPAREGGETRRILFTAAEERQADEDEVKYAGDQIAGLEAKTAELLRQQELDPLEAKLDDDSITFDELKALIRLRGGGG